ncbi:MAG TPA: hypothetical protein VG845_02925 [Dehalococcoidia bacterium]|nr:hypothetical protein [Dehalococcoidia bacterium]
MPQELITGRIYGEQPARERTCEFLLAEADRPLAELLTSVEAAHAQLAASLGGVGAVQAAFEPGGEGEDAFSIAQVARHVAGSAAIMAERLEAIGLGQEPKRGTSPGNFGDVEVETQPELEAPLHQALDQTLKRRYWS